MKPGGRQYRAWVGPPADYDVMAANQVGLLLSAGLREAHKLCDVGCGSLRGGRMLIPYLLPGNYYGIEPDREMLQQGIDNELGQDMIRLKQPHFLHGSDFPLSEFGVDFDFVLCQSIWSHCYPDLLLEGFGKVEMSLADNGMMLATYQESGEKTEGSGWLYPGCVPYRWGEIGRTLDEAGLVGRQLGWKHPRQVWFVAMKRGQEGRVSDFAMKIKPLWNSR